MESTPIQALAERYQDEIVAIRRDLHRHPELSFEEFRTAEVIRQKLNQWDFEQVSSICETGVVASIRGRNPQKRCIALRADMDALPISEQNDCEYKSLNHGVMHACGHDAHTAMLLGAAKILNELKDHFEGSIKCIFQPGEEKLPGGAQKMIEAGVLENVDCIIAQHCFPDLPCGQVGFASGQYMASCNEINFIIKGKGGHAAKPEQTDDIVWIAARAISELQLKVKSKMGSTTPYLLRFGQFIANGTYNVIPDEISIKGTFRTYDERCRREMIQFMTDFMQQEIRSYGLAIEIKIEEGYPFLNNDAVMYAQLKEKAKEYLGAENVKDLFPLYTSEDFAWYSQQVPALFYRLGTSNTKKGIVSRQHTATFDIDESCLKTGMGLMAWLALNQLQQ